MLLLRRSLVQLFRGMVLFGATFCLLVEKNTSEKWKPPEYVATPMVEATRKATFNPEARYIALARYTGMHHAHAHSHSH